MARIEHGLGLGEGQPHQRIEQVMPVMCPHLHFACEIAARLILRFERQFATLLRHKTQRRSALDGDGRMVRCKQRIAIVQCGEIT